MDPRPDQAAAVRDLLAGYQDARAKSQGQPWRAEVINDIRRSAAAARDALKAESSPLEKSVQDFLDATEPEDTYQRIKRFGDAGFAALDVVGAVTGYPALQGIRWPVVIAAGVGAAVFAFLFVVNVAAALVAALPVGLVLARAPMLLSEGGKSLLEYLTQEDPGRDVINRTVVPAETEFFRIFVGRPPRVRTTTVSTTTETAAVVALAAAVVIGGALGLLLAMPQSG